VALIRRSGCEAYERVAEEFRGRVPAVVRILPVHDSTLVVLRQLRPKLVFAVGQSAFELALKSTAVPILHVLVYHNPPAGGEAPPDPTGAPLAIPSRVPPKNVLDLFRLIRPNIRHIAVLHGSSSSQAMEAARQAAGPLGLQLLPLLARSPAQAIDLLRRMRPGEASGQPTGKIGGVWLLTDLQILTPQVLQYALRVQFSRGLPLVGATRRQVEQGALLAVDLEPHALGQQAASIANQILAGVPRKKISVSVGKTRICVNRGAAQTLGVPLALLRSAGAELVE